MKLALLLDTHSAVGGREVILGASLIDTHPDICRDVLGLRKGVSWVDSRETCASRRKRTEKANPGKESKGRNKKGAAHAI